MSKNRHPSIMLVLAHAAKGSDKVCPETVAMLKAAGGVEQQHGTRKTMSALLGAFASTATTLTANGALDADLAVEWVSDILDQVTGVRDALRSGKPLPHTAIVGAVGVPSEVSAAWGKRTGGNA